MTGEFFDAGESSTSPRRASGPGPALRQDIPRPPLRTLLLTTWRHGALGWQHGRARFHAAQRELISRARAGAARLAAQAIARLDAHVWQPALWPFRPAQREMLARTLAVLSVAIFAAGWVAAYNTLAPADAARPPAAALPAPPSPKPKPFTARVVSHALPAAQVRLAVPIEGPERPARPGK